MAAATSAYRGALSVSGSQLAMGAAMARLGKSFRGQWAQTWQGDTLVLRFDDEADLREAEAAFVAAGLQVKAAPGPIANAM